MKYSEKQLHCKGEWNWISYQSGHFLMWDCEISNMSDFQNVRLSKCAIFKMCDFQNVRFSRKSHILVKIAQKMCDFHKNVRFS